MKVHQVNKYRRKKLMVKSSTMVPSGEIGYKFYPPQKYPLYSTQYVT